ncbi:hypothetical protein [Defluviimonas salinarum]|uniref:DUF3368 domain-containing protein n=1 Tax=Defluviimonas salinarum TaxID=2992147 RepID=A0ABT3J5H8_9RHOB|nr:hypothetical protein [Defluviimonas salinarum]MCW3782924.1 hypothetical protein [Defluviimonas salinarum]
MALEIVIPDSGPLMSLGRIDRLDLLDRFNCPILITDMVADEILRGKPGAPDASVFEAWFAKRGNRIQTIETSIGMMWKAIPEDIRATLKRVRDAGETSIWQFSNTIRDTMAADDEALVLFEDAAVKKMDFGPHIRKLSTWSFLIALERAGVIPSAQTLRNDMMAANRTIPSDPFDQPSPKMAGRDEDWIAGYDARPDMDDPTP